MWREVALIAGKDLRVELRSRIVLNQVVPFALVVLLLFGIALDPDRGFLRRAAPGLYWIAVLLSSLLVVQRAFAVESADGGRDALRVAGLDPAALFLGKAIAAAAVLGGLEVVLAFGVSLLYGVSLTGGLALLLVASVLATASLVAPGIIYGALASGARARETLLPLLFLPAVAPVMIGATRAFEAALRQPVSLAEGWRWCGLLGVFAVTYTALGLLIFEPLLEDS
ncbi:MAG: transcriptional regulator [Acidimicrobiia bacterium]|nr:transcriptional regulator [Acidimicrobiia bacterium]